MHYKRYVSTTENFKVNRNKIVQYTSSFSFVMQ